MRGLGVEAFKWTALITGVISFAYSLIAGGGFSNSFIAALFIGVIAGGMVSLGADKIHEP